MFRDEIFVLGKLCRLNILVSKHVVTIRETCNMWAQNVWKLNMYLRTKHVSTQLTGAKSVGLNLLGQNVRELNMWGFKRVVLVSK